MCLPQFGSVGAHYKDTLIRCQHAPSRPLFTFGFDSSPLIRYYIGAFIASNFFIQYLLYSSRCHGTVRISRKILAPPGILPILLKEINTTIVIRTGSTTSFDCLTCRWISYALYYSSHLPCCLAQQRVKVQT